MTGFFYSFVRIHHAIHSIMKKIQVLSLPLIIISTFAVADLKTDVAKCAAMKSDATRLICFDKVSVNQKIDAPRTESFSGAGKWQGRVETSPIDDSKNAFLTLEADTPVRNKYRSNTPTLIVRCKEKRLEAYITFDIFLGSDSMRVLTRFDKRPAQRVSWGISTDHKGVFVGGSIATFIKEMMNSESLLVELTPYGESPVMATFDVRGIADASKVLQQTCPWK